MLSVFCRNRVSCATIVKLFQPNLRGFSAFNSRLFKANLVKLESKILPKRNTHVNIKGDRFRRKDNIPEGYHLIYREKKVGYLYFFQISSCIFLPYTFLRLICYHFDWKLSWDDFGINSTFLNFSFMEFGFLNSLESIFNPFEDNDNEGPFKKSGDSDFSYVLQNRMGFPGEVYFLFFLVIVSNLIILKTSLRTPIRIYAKDKDRIAVFHGLLGPFKKKHVHFQRNECRPIIPIPFFLWRNWQVRIKDKYYVMIISSFKDIGDLNSTIYQEPVHTFTSRLFEKIGRLLGQ